MDDRLVAWARAVKARKRKLTLPPLWLFTDPARMPDLDRVVAGLPRGLCGVVFRHDGVPGRAALARQVVRHCRARRIPVVVAGGLRVAGAGVHLRGGRRSGHAGLPGLLTSSAHDRTQVLRARRAGAALVFVSPMFATASHPGALPLGPCRWLALSRGVAGAAALGGITGQSIRRLPPGVAGVGAIGALLA